MRQINIDVKQRRFRAVTRRPQTWYWVAKGGNGKRLCRSAGFFTNKQDAYDNIDILFNLLSAPDVTIFRREAEHGNVLIRQGVDPTQT